MTNEERDIRRKLIGLQHAEKIGNERRPNTLFDDVVKRRPELPPLQMKAPTLSDHAGLVRLILEPATHLPDIGVI